MARHKDLDWNLPVNTIWEAVHAALLMDLRDELKEIRRRLAPLQCPNFLDIPARLSRIERNTRKRKRRPAQRTK